VVLSAVVVAAVAVVVAVGMQARTLENTKMPVNARQTAIVPMKAAIRQWTIGG
jgi:hypothetical protein